MKQRIIATAAMAAVVAACATPESKSDEAYQAAYDQTFAQPAPDQQADEDVAFDGSLQAYIDYALRHRQELQAELLHWRADRRAVDAAYRLPAPVLTYGYFFQSVETRVGPQQHKLNLSQKIPWPGKSSATESVAQAKAEVGQYTYSAKLIAIRNEVQLTYWDIWYTDQATNLLKQQVEILKSLAQAARTRVETGKTTIADVGQVELAVSRTLDKIAMLEQRRIALEADLVYALGAPQDVEPLPVKPNSAELVSVGESTNDLAQSAQAHPQILKQLEQAQVYAVAAEASDSDRYPDFGVGVDYVFVGEEGPADDAGKDAVAAFVSVSLPIWFDDYAANRDTAEARQRAVETDVEAKRHQVQSKVKSLVSSLQDAQRRHDLYGNTLIPQAETVYASVLGAYEVGQGNVAAIMLAQKDLIELRVAQAAAARDHHKTRAALESVVGRPIAGGNQ